METTAIVTQDLRAEIAQMIALSNEMGIVVVDSPESAQTASDTANAVAAVEKKIKAVFKEPKEKAYQMHKAITAEEKKYLTPLENFERDLKNKVGAYAYKVEQERRRAEEEARRKAAEEAERKMAEAIRLEEERKAAEAQGDEAKAEELAIQAEAAVELADAIDIVADTIAVAAPPKPTGMSFIKDWTITETNLAEMPTVLNGIPLVKVDTQAILKLIKASNGKIVIPGVKYQEYTRTVRRG